MARKRTCSQCGSVNDYAALRCVECGTHFRKAEAQPDAPQGMSGKCEYPGCGMPGALTDSTRGGGPYFCRWHFKDRTGPIAAEVVELSRGFVSDETPEKLFQATQDAADRFCRDNGLDTIDARRAFIRESLATLGKRPSSKDWARRLIADFKSGDRPVSDLQLRFACEALGLSDDDVRAARNRVPDEALA